MAGMSPNVLLIDAEYLDRVAAHLAANLQPAIGRQLPKADLAQWLVCCALDAGLSAGNNEVQAIFIHPREMKVLSHFAPGNFAAQLDGKAFSDALGEFTMAACPIERVTTLPDFYKESFEALLLDAAIERIMVVADFDGTSAESRSLTADIQQLCARPPQPKNADGSPMVDADGKRIILPRKDIVLLTMVPLSGTDFRQTLLGFSIMAAMGIRADELKW